MAAIQRDESDQRAIREQLDRILRSGAFLHSRRRQRFLEFLVNETLAGRGERLKGYNIALEVFDRPETFDPIVHPLVRTEAARLREKLREYYDTEGQSDPIRIDLPKGTYTPQIKFRQAEKPNDVVAPQSRFSAKTRSRYWAAGIISVFALLLAGFGVWRSLNPAVPLPERASIAVLPFENIGDDPRWDHFADGITEDIVTDLSHSKDLIVIARNSTEVYKGQPVDIRQIGRDLNVKYVLEGSIQSLGERIRVTVQLIEAASGSHIWSERYDRPVDDLFAVQNDVTQRIRCNYSWLRGSGRGGRAYSS